MLALAGGNGVLDLIALTLRQGDQGLEAYAALRNDGEVPACHATLSLELYDQDQSSLAVGTGALLSTRFYRLDDGSGTLTSCVAPGDVTMAAIGDFPSDVTSGDVRSVVYRCPYFALSVVPIAGLSVRDLKSRTQGSGVTYAGSIVNGFDRAMKEPSIVIFPVNRAGRPLGVVTSGAAVEIPPSGSWAFETSAFPVERATDQLAYPEASIAN